MIGADPLFAQVVLVAFFALLVLTVAHLLKQPPVIAYIITGIISGPAAIGLISNQEVIQILGEFGLALLLFFVGMEIDVHLLLRKWRAVIVGTALQMTLGVSCVALVGLYLGWEAPRIVLLGFVISLSSTAVVLRHLEATGLLGTTVGTYVSGILFTQDVAVTPMLVVLTTVASGFTLDLFMRQVFGLVALAGLFYIFWAHKFTAPHFLKQFLEDHERALFFNITVGLGIAVVSGFLGLSIGMGAFLAGILVAKHYSRKRIWRQLESLKTILVAAFFMSIGVLIDLSFLVEHLSIILLLVGMVLVVNTVVNAGIFWFLNVPLRYSLYMAALLAQIGEFSFFLALVGREYAIVGDYAYQVTIEVIAVSLLISPLWTALFRHLEPNTHARIQQAT
jgi:CPA2 family monovalent cation:H+ antiporter-2